MKSKKKYSQLRAMIAIARASLTASFRNPSNVFFGVLFPFIFILVFGFLGQGESKLKVGLINSDKNNFVYQALDTTKQINLIKDQKDSDLQKKLKKGDLDAILQIKKTGCEQTLPNGSCALPLINLSVTTSKASAQNGQLFLSVLNGIAAETNLKASQIKSSPITIQSNEISGKKYKTIDFILPGMLGFSLMSSGIFSTAFVFINLRNTLVIKRITATPARRFNIVIGEAISRLVFALMQTLIIITVGTLLLGFTLSNGAETFINMLVMAIMGLIVFLGLGFIASSLAKTEQSAPAIANLMTMPQMLLSGVFFSSELLPSWLQPISNVLPLSYLSSALRDISFNGASLWDERIPILMLAVWGVVIYAIAIKIFKWEPE
jgi:ABC-2 type transport system permease protein